MFGVLLNQKNADTGLSNFLQGAEQFPTKQWREAQGRLVQHQNCRRRHHRPSDGDHLLFTAAHGAGQLPPPFGKFGKYRQHPIQIGGLISAGAFGVGTQHQVFLYRQFAEQRTAFRHQGQTPFDNPMRFPRGDCPASHHHVAVMFHVYQTGDGVQQGTLSGSVGAQNDNDFAGLDIDRNAAQGLMMAVEYGDIAAVKQAHLQDRHGSLPHHSKHLLRPHGFFEGGSPWHNGLLSGHDHQLRVCAYAGLR